MNLSDIFDAVAIKRLAAVDLPGYISNQHEINGVAKLKQFFQTDTTIHCNVNWLYFTDDEEPLRLASQLTFYDARAKSANRTGRSEWRLYYADEFLKCATPGDVMVLARPGTGSGYGGRADAFAFVFQQDSSWLTAARALFSFDEVSDNARTLPFETLNDTEFEFARQRILQELGIALEPPVLQTDLELVIRRFGEAFPGTREMSEFTRSLVQVDPRADADRALATWIEREEQLFRAREAVEVEARILHGFQLVDEFLTYSLSIQNRRKSRMGHALQHHLEALFNANGLRFETQRVTEGKNKPDFLFPGQAEYRDQSFAAAGLSMLAAKSSCKDRWRQILTEAVRIPDKHLCTLQPGISVDQTDEMRVQRVTLVVPAPLHITYTQAQRNDLMSLQGFIAYVKALQ